jgi:hypothetical protein
LKLARGAKKKEDAMSQNPNSAVAVIGIDIGKNSFHVVGLDTCGAKIAASKRKGLWVGGMAPLGYETKDRKITVNEPEAERVRTIFRRYLELRSLHRLMADLRERGGSTWAL